MERVQVLLLDLVTATTAPAVALLVFEIAPVMVFPVVVPPNPKILVRLPFWLMETDPIERFAVVGLKVVVALLVPEIRLTDARVIDAVPLVTFTPAVMFTLPPP